MVSHRPVKKIMYWGRKFCGLTITFFGNEILFSKRFLVIFFQLESTLPSVIRYFISYFASSDALGFFVNFSIKFSIFPVVKGS